MCLKHKHMVSSLVCHVKVVLNIYCIYVFYCVTTSDYV